MAWLPLCMPWMWSSASRSLRISSISDIAIRIPPTVSNQSRCLSHWAPGPFLSHVSTPTFVPSISLLTKSLLLILPCWGPLVQEGAVTCIQAIGFPVVDGDPESVALSDGIGRTGAGTGSVCTAESQQPFRMWPRGGALVETDVFLESTYAGSIQETKCTKTASVFGHLERDLGA
jgi:hypothetical protein